MDVYCSSEKKVDLKQIAASGVKWTTLSTTLITFIQFIQLVILARLLSPTDFGLMSMIMVVIGFANSFSDMGISNAIIYKQDTTKEQLSSLYWLNIFASTILFILVWTLTPLIVNFYREPQLGNLIFWVALVFPLTSFGQQFQILLQKRLQFDRLSKIEVISVVFGSMIAIGAAIKGQGVFSLIWGQLSTAGARSLLFVLSSMKEWLPTFRFRYHDLKGYLGFGLYQMGERSVNYLAANVDYLIIGRFLGANVLGIYTLAYQLVIMPLMKINPIVTRVAFPIFAKKQTDNTALCTGYLKMSRIIAMIIFPLLVGLATISPLFIPIVYGSQWNPAISLVQILSILGILKALGNPSGSVYLAKGRADIGFYWNIIVAIINTLVFWFFVRWGVYGVACSYVILSVIYFPIGLILLYLIIGLKWRDYFSILRTPVFMSTVMGLSILIAYFFAKVFISDFLLFVSLIFFGIIIYSILAILFERAYLSELIKLFIGK